MREPGAVTSASTAKTLSDVPGSAYEEAIERTLAGTFRLPSRGFRVYLTFNRVGYYETIVS